jgi:hypothetical protein
VEQRLDATEKRFCRANCVAPLVEEFHDDPELLGNARFSYGLHRAAFIETTKTFAMDLHVLQVSKLLGQGRSDPTEQSQTVLCYHSDLLR